MVEPQVGSTTSTRDVYSRRGPALRPPPACRMTRAEVTLLIQQQQQLPLSACLCMCGVCGADHIGWLGEGDLDLSSLRCFPWHGTWAVLYVAAPHTAPFGSNRLVSLCLSSVVGNRCSRWAGEMGIAPHSPRGWHLSAVAFQRRKIDTEPSEHAARQKEKGYVFAWHGMAGCLVCMARWCANTASCQPSWLLVLHAIQPSPGPSFPGLDVHMAGEPNQPPSDGAGLLLEGMPFLGTVRLYVSCHSQTPQYLPKRRRWWWWWWWHNLTLPLPRARDPKVHAGNQETKAWVRRSIVWYRWQKSLLAGWVPLAYRMAGSSGDATHPLLSVWWW